jgi:GTP cyclohydrolase IA
MDPKAAERAVADFLRALGHEVQGELAQTPGLVAQAWTEELLSGYKLDPARILREGAVPIEPGQASLVALRGLAVCTVCPHHLLPAHGEATVIYLPEDRVAGFGAIARALDALTRRLTFQERAGTAMAKLVVAELGARGALCSLRLAHTCLQARGPRQATALVDSVAFAGCFSQPGPDREAALCVLGQAPDAAALGPDPHTPQREPGG